MATSTIANSPTSRAQHEPSLTIHEAVELLSREERFMATVAAMNTLLISKGIYTQSEFDQIFCKWAEAQQLKPKNARIGKLG